MMLESQGGYIYAVWRSKIYIKNRAGTIEKFRFVAEYNARSANRELEVLMKKHIADFEKAHGKIEIE